MVLSRRENLDLQGKRSLKIVLAANKRLNTAYVLKEVFGQLWDYEREGWARRFFDNWRASLKWRPGSTANWMKEGAHVKTRKMSGQKQMILGAQLRSGNRARS